MNEIEERKGYAFEGWYIDPEYKKRLNPGGILPHELTLYDKWTLIEYDVTYQLDGGQNHAMNPDKVTIESGFIKLYPAYKKGMLFKCWTLNGKVTDIIPAQIYEPICLVAHYQPFFTVHFETRGGGMIENKKVNEQGKLEEFRPPMKLGYEFENWYWDVNCQHVFTFDQTIPKSCILYANWKVKQYQITYNTNGGTSFRSNPKSYTYFDDIIQLKPAFKKGYRFIGWYDTRGNKQNTILPYSIGDKTFIAHFEKIEPKRK
ncbi:InlB B-repeat-containing protein [Floccifex sp.]|uniref:InlB B-repeat-containing protein n=1 Tax=Floccifex sp. TaxID=2815810 RepID=UPI003F0A49AE